CGPEIMMLKVLQQTKEKDIPTQVSLHRYIKCGVGICGHCVMDETGFRVCKEGPTFRDKEMEKTIEFGKYWRNASGTKIYFGGKK
ncbi:MAG: dihydroorotate dehydrogenase electron transfer subunit, partial [Euryarchaeota archaeon]|nr:dihydroorotate dehydrogenase electron transfer subunit [Euryarchaeota archaeon]